MIIQYPNSLPNSTAFVWDNVRAHTLICFRKCRMTCLVDHVYLFVGHQGPCLSETILWHVATVPSSHSPAVVHSGSCGRWVSRIWRSNFCRRSYLGVHFRTGQGSFVDGVSLDPVFRAQKKYRRGMHLRWTPRTSNLARRQVVTARL